MQEGIRVVPQRLDRDAHHVARAGEPRGAVADRALGEEAPPAQPRVDALVRFGKYIESIKGAPVALSAFFDRDAPSTAARRRLTKLVALVKHVSTTIEHHKGSLRDYRSWQEEFRALHSALASLEQAGRESKLADAMLRPELAAAREAWLSVYTANKALISGVLRHAGRIELLPLVFDDLAEQHRAAGVSDATPTPAPVDPQPTA